MTFHWLSFCLGITLTGIAVGIAAQIAIWREKRRSLIVARVETHDTHAVIVLRFPTADNAEEFLTLMKKIGQKTP